MVKPTKKVVSKKSREERFEDIDVEVDEDTVVHNRRKQRRADDFAVLPADAHKLDDDDDFEAKGEEAELVEAAAKAIRKQVSDADFDVGTVSSKVAPKKKSTALAQQSAVVEAVERDFNALTTDERVAILRKESPELIAMLDEVKKYLHEVKTVSEPLQEILHSAKLSTTEQKQMLSFLETKTQLMLTYCLHVTFYLLMKAEGKSVKGHPVIDRLVELRVYLEKLWPLEEKLQYSLNKLLASSGSNTANFKNLRPLKGDDSGVYRAPKSGGVDDEAKTRRQERKAARDAEELQKEEESAMTRFQTKKTTAAKSFDRVRPADEGYREDEDQYFSKITAGDEDDDDKNLSLVERLKNKQNGPPSKKKPLLDEADDDDDSEEDLLGDVEDIDLDDIEEDDNDLDEYDALVEEEETRNAQTERLKAMPRGERTVKEVERRKIGKKIESHRGLTKARPKDRKTPRTAQKYKYKKGMQKVKSQVREVQPEPEKGFVGVRSIKANVTHSTKFNN